MQALSPLPQCICDSTMTKCTVPIWKVTRLYSPHAGELIFGYFESVIVLIHLAEHSKEVITIFGFWISKVD